jgi:hypothetical protein
MKLLLTLLIATTGLMAKDRLPQPAPAKGWARDVVAAVIVAESGGHGRKGMEAVYEVIHARGTQRNRNCVEIVIAKKQFSCLNGTTPNSLVKKMRKHPEFKWVEGELLKWVPITSHTGTNPYNRATHYHATSCSPWWAKGKKPLATFGGHKWYKGIK